MNQTSEQLLDPLVGAFTADTGVRFSGVPPGIDGQRQLLRALMNVRQPGPLSPDVLRLQDEYLKMRNLERGIAHCSDIPTVDESLDSEIQFADKIALWQGDITTLDCDAIVNAANSQMLGCFQPCHACIDNCIHTYAGIQLRLECDSNMKELRKQFGSDYTQPTAVPMLTDSYNLPCRKVIHIVGPIVYDILTPDLEEDLRRCYINTLDMCKENGLRTVAFCCISTGVFRFPNRRAAEIVVQAVTEWLEDNEDSIDKVIFDVFLEKDREIYRDLLG